MDSEKDLYRLLKLITKITGFVIKNPDHQSFKEDVINEAFLKLYNSELIKKSSFEIENEALVIASYSKKTIHTCYMDYLVKSGVLRRSTKEERQKTNLKTQNISSIDIHNDGEHGAINLEQTEHYTPDQYLSAKRAYAVIKDCFDKGIITIKDKIRAVFFESVFWDYNQFDLPLNQLAKLLGYKNSNPTQDFNRFVEKVSACTSKSDIRIVKINEQIEILRQIIQAGEARV